jgi:phosphatidylserine/phosphatidylglycerophosphate/cardiolipin synthase-like enzyme
LISPFLRLNDRVKELLEDKNRLKIDVRIVYGKNELHPEEINWLRALSFVRTSFCKNLHAKCYLNEESCIITSLNLYEFSQVNNNEMGVYLSRSSDGDLYREAFEEAQRIIRISDEVRMSLEKVAGATQPIEVQSNEQEETNDDGLKLTSSKIAKKWNMRTNEFFERLIDGGFIELNDGKHFLTDKGKSVGGEFRMSKKFGPYFLWPETFVL